MPKSRRHPRRVAALVYDGLCSFEFGVAAEIFALDRPEMGADWYQFVPCTEHNRPVRAGGGLVVQAERGLSALNEAGTIIIPGWPAADPAPSPALSAALKRAHNDGARLVSICSGAFLLAESGLLDGRKATTHWRYTERFRAAYPKVNLMPEVLYIDNGDILTSAGSAAGIDLLLHIVRCDFGATAANMVARRLVSAPYRTGGQQQFIETPVPRIPDETISALLEKIRTKLNHTWRIQEMASACAMSERTFARKFRSLTGYSPGDWLAHERLERARRLLETSNAALGDVASSTGLGAPENLVRQFKKRVGVTPGEYRRRFYPLVVGSIGDAGDGDSWD